MVAVLFQQVFRPDGSGMLNGPLMALGLEPVGFLSDPDVAFWSVLGVHGLAGGRVLRGALLGRARLHPAGHVRGGADRRGRAGSACSSGSRCRCSGTPSRSAWVYLGILALDVFAIVWVMTDQQGGPDFSTTVMAAEIYRNAFQYFRFGYASALGVVMFFFTIGFAILSLRLSRRERIEY